MELEKLLSVQGEKEQIDPEEYSLLLEQADFPDHEVSQLLQQLFYHTTSWCVFMCVCVCVCVYRH